MHVDIATLLHGDSITGTFGSRWSCLDKTCPLKIVTCTHLLFVVLKYFVRDILLGLVVYSIFCFLCVQIQWLLENYETAEGVSLPRCTLYNHYLRHCAANKIDAVNAASFGKLIRSVFIGLKTRRLGTRWAIVMGEGGEGEREGGRGRGREREMEDGGGGEDEGCFRGWMNSKRTIICITR